LSHFTSFNTHASANYDLTLKFAQNPLKFTIRGMFVCWF